MNFRADIRRITAGLFICMAFNVSPAFSGEKEYCQLKYQWEVAYYGVQRVNRLNDVPGEIKPGFSVKKIIGDLYEQKRKIEDLRYNFQSKASPLVDNELRVANQLAEQYLDITIESYDQHIRALEEVTAYPAVRDEIRIVHDYYIPKTALIEQDIKHEIDFLKNTYPKACATKAGKIFYVIAPIILVIIATFYWINFKAGQ